MLRVLLILLAIVLTYVGIRMAVFALASDETQIRWIVERMEEGYNDGKVSPCMDSIAADWTHEGAGVVRADLKAGLQRQFLTERDKQGPRFRAEVDWEAFEVEIEDGSAHIVCDVHFLRRRADTWESRGRTRIEADLRDGEDGWEIRASRHTHVEGRGF